MSLTKIAFISSLLVTLHGAFAREAPGDHDEFCRSGTNEQNHIFPDEWEVLVDTYDYTFLYGSLFAADLNVWQARSFDQDSATWENLFGGLCTQSLYTCTFDSGPQENWLFSQYINYQGANEIFFNVSYRFTQCTARAQCTDDFVTLNRYDTDSSSSDREDISSYRPLIGDKMTSRLQQPQSQTNDVDRTLSFLRPEPRTRGFYLGLQDSGTCGQINRVIMYYTVCRAKQTELVTYPEVGSPPRAGPDAVFLAQCVPNAHNVTSLDVTAFSANGTCRDVAPGGARCECNAGYMISSDRRACQACGQGNFRALGLSNTCQACPSNTVRDIEAAGVCQCIPGFFRKNTPGQEEGPEVECTAPPSRITSLEVARSNSQSITVVWQRPLETGRSDFYYEIFISAITERTTRVVESSYVDRREIVDYTISGLKPFTSYKISVVTHNGVSEQDPENVDRRTVEVDGDTTEGVPGIPSVNRLCTVVIWKPPVDPAGIIVRFDVRFQESSDNILQFGPNENFHITSESLREVNAIVQVRAVNSFAESRWTDPLPLDCTGNMGCPPVVVPTAGPSSATAAPVITPGASTTSAAPPTAVPDVLCVTPPSPVQGSVSMVNGEAQFSCNEGLTLVGEATQRCINGVLTGNAPTCVESCKLLPVHFELKGVSLPNNSQIQLQELGRDEDSLMAVTQFEGCCQDQRLGEFIYPNGDLVGRNNDLQPFFRNRRGREVHLHQRDSSLSEEKASLLGRFGCEILDGCGDTTRLYITIVS